MNNAAYLLRPAVPGDTEAVYGLYRSLVGSHGCSWDEEYPALENVEEDLTSGSLYVAQLSGVVCAAVAAGPFDELADAGWALFPGFCEIARMAVERQLWGTGLGQKLLVYAMGQAADRGFLSARLLAYAGNPHALSLYRRLDFIRRERVFAWGRDYFGFERML